MDALAQYSIPVSGMRNGMHEFDFTVDSGFFKHFEASPIQEGTADVRLYFEKRTDMYVMVFDFSGSIQTECDRCLDEMELPIEGNEQLLVKFDEEPGEEEAEVIYIPYGLQELNVARYIYEFICLAVPLIKTHDDSDEECNPEMLKRLNGDSETNESAEERRSSVWDALKDFKEK